MHQSSCHDIRSPNLLLTWFQWDTPWHQVRMLLSESGLCICYWHRFLLEISALDSAKWLDSRHVFANCFPNVSSCSISFPCLLSDLPFSKVLSLVQIRSIKGHGVQKVQPIVLQEAECSFMACHDDGMGVLMGAGDNVIEVRGVICLQSRGVAMSMNETLTLTKKVELDLQQRHVVLKAMASLRYNVALFPRKTECLCNTIWPTLPIDMNDHQLWAMWIMDYVTYHHRIAFKPYSNWERYEKGDGCSTQWSQSDGKQDTVSNDGTGDWSYQLNGFCDYWRMHGECIIFWYKTLCVWKLSGIGKHSFIHSFASKNRIPIPFVYR